MKQLDAVIIGGGLAGLACAEALSAANNNIMVLEAMGHLGGRTASWDDNGMEVESRLQQVLGLSTQLLDLLTQAGIDESKILKWEDVLEVRIPGNPSSALLHVDPTQQLLDKSGLMSKEELKLFATFFKTGLARLASEGEALDKFSVADVARDTGLSQQLIDRVLVPLTEGRFFLKPAEHSAYPFFELVKHLMSKSSRKQIGTFMGPMSEVMIEPLASRIEEQGGEISTDVRVTSLTQDNQGVFQLETALGDISSTNVIIATSMRGARRLIKTQWGDHEGFKSFFEIESQPAVSLQIELDKPALDTDRVILAPGTSLAAFAEQSHTTFPDSKGRLSIILADPAKHLYTPQAELLKIVLADLEKVGVKVPKVIDYRKVAHHEDFYKLSPGTEAKRPLQKTPVKGLYLAGDYTKQPLMATMEGAVISGRLAADAVLGR